MGIEKLAPLADADAYEAGVIRKRGNSAVRRAAMAAVGVAIAGAVIGVAPAGARTSAAATAPSAPSTQLFGFTGGTQFFTVPDGVHRIHLTAAGGAGGSGGERSGLYAAPGGLGALIDLDAAVNPGDTLVVQVGGQGGNTSGQSAGGEGSSAGSGENGGPGGNVNSTDDGTAGGGGGGGTTVVDATTGIRFLIAAGGGGGGGGGQLYGYNGGQGGDAGTSTPGRCDPTYGPGVYGSGLTGGAGGQCSDSPYGRSGISGSGETPELGAGTGGGGGGGLVGGDGGAAGGSSGGGAGGGGAGTSFWSPAASNAVVGNGGPRDGRVVVSWTADARGTPRTASFSGGTSFTVPAGVYTVTVTAWGGSGGLGGGNAVGHIQPRGGLGALIRETVPVVPNHKLTIAAGGAGGNGDFFSASDRTVPFNGGSGGASNVDAGGGNGGNKHTAHTGTDSGDYFAGGTGGGGGGATVVLDSSTILLEAGGGGGGGGDSDAAYGSNGGPGGNAGSSLVTGDNRDGNGYYGSGGSPAGYSNGSGGVSASAGAENGQPAADDTDGNVRGTGGGGGGGVIGGGAGGQCNGFVCGGTGGGGAAGSSYRNDEAYDVTFGNSLGGDGRVIISWVEPAAQTIAFTSQPPAHPVVGSSYTPTATGGGSGNPVLFSIDSSSIAGACSISAGKVTFTGGGTCIVDANQAGNEDYLPADQVQQTLNAAQAAQTIAFTSTPPAQPMYGGSYTPAATGGGSGNAVLFSIDSSSDARACSIDDGTVSFTGVGTCVIDADQAGNDDYLPAKQVQQAFTIARAAQTIAFTSMPPADAVYGGSYTPAATGGDSGNAVLFSIDSSSDAGACAIDAGKVSFTGVGSCVIDADQAGDERYLPAGQVHQTPTIAKATLTVTADDNGKPFGDPVPPLTTTISGFVNGETLTTSGVSGEADCTTTATAASPGGTYPITCGAGSLSAAHYAFSFTEGTLTVSFARTVTGSYSGRLNVAAGKPVLIGPGTSVSGPVTVAAGGALQVDGATITGPVRASGAAGIRVCNATVEGPTTVTGSGGLAILGDGSPGCPGNRFTGPVRITGNNGGVIFDRNTVNGPLTIAGNTGTLPAPHSGTVAAIGNTVSGKTDIQL